MRKFTILVGFVAIAVLASCASITRGTEDVLEIKSEPAGAQVQTSNGYSCNSTPCAIRMKRRSELVVEISKPGCRTARVNVTHKTPSDGAAMVAGNVIFGGIIGLGVDAATGASQELVPNPVEVRLSC